MKYILAHFIRYVLGAFVIGILVSCLIKEPLECGKITQVEQKIGANVTLRLDKIGIRAKKMKNLRKVWFKEWLHENAEINQSKILEFHQDETKGTPKISLKMKRSFVETVSVTSIKKIEENIDLVYKDFLINSL